MCIQLSLCVLVQRILDTVYMYGGCIRVAVCMYACGFCVDTPLPRCRHKDGAARALHVFPLVHLSARPDSDSRFKRMWTYRWFIRYRVSCKKKKKEEKREKRDRNRGERHVCARNRNLTRLFEAQRIFRRHITTPRKSDIFIGTESCHLSVNPRQRNPDAVLSFCRHGYFYMNIHVRCICMRRDAINK